MNLNVPHTTNECRVAGGSGRSLVMKDDVHAGQHSPRFFIASSPKCYRDTSVLDSQPPKEDAVVLSFPQRLMEVLDTHDYKEVISWTEDGLAFRIDQPDYFTKHILPKHFRKTAKLTSFKRRLLRWGFARLEKGENRGAYSNPFFRKGGHKFLGRLSCRTRQPAHLRCLPDDDRKPQQKAEANNSSGSFDSSSLDLLASAATQVREAPAVEQDVLSRYKVGATKGYQEYNIVGDLALQLTQNLIIEQLQSRVLEDELLRAAHEQMKQEALIRGLSSLSRQPSRDTFPITKYPSHNGLLAENHVNQYLLMAALAIPTQVDPPFLSREQGQGHLPAELAATVHGLRRSQKLRRHG